MAGLGEAGGDQEALWAQRPSVWPGPASGRSTCCPSRPAELRWTQVASASHGRWCARETSSGRVSPLRPSPSSLPRLLSAPSVLDLSVLTLGHLCPDSSQ